MAIPTWTWTDRAPEATPAPDAVSAAESTGQRDAGSDPDLSRAADQFDLLASPVRLEVLLALADRDGTVRYTDLRAATSIEDNGKLNYHLRRLEAYVSSGEDGYELTARGRRLLDRLP